MSFQNSLDSTGKIQRNYLPTASVTNVNSLNGLTGAVTLVGSGQVSVTPAGQNITINVPSAVTPTRTLLGNYSGTVTGESASVALTSGGQSNITVVQGGVYALQGNFAIIASGPTDYGFDLFINNGSTDAKILAGNTASYKPAGVLNGIENNFCCVFVATGTAVQFFIASEAGAGALETVQASIATPELIRIL